MLDIFGYILLTLFTIYFTGLLLMFLFVVWTFIAIVYNVLKSIFEPKEESNDYD